MEAFSGTIGFSLSVDWLIASRFMRRIDWKRANRLRKKLRLFERCTFDTECTFEPPCHGLRTCHTSTLSVGSAEFGDRLVMNHPV